VSPSFLVKDDASDLNGTTSIFVGLAKSQANDF